MRRRQALSRNPEKLSISTTMRNAPVSVQPGAALAAAEIGPPMLDLAARYEERFGRKPHWKMKPETMLERLNGAV